jgi:tetratricopeptide (TPR) repeat protein
MRASQKHAGRAGMARRAFAQGVLICALSLCAAQESRAGEEPKTQAEAPSISSAQQHAGQAFFRRGQRLYREGKYEAAWLEFSSAYEIAPHPELMLNMAQCKAKSNHPKEAVHHYREFLRMRPDDPENGNINREITRLEQEMNGPAPAVASSSPSRRIPIAGTILAVGTVLFVVAGGTAVGIGMSRFGELSNSCKPICSDDRVQTVRTPLNAGYAMFGLAAAAAVATAIVLPYELDMFGKKKGADKGRGAKAALMLGPGSLTLLGRF